MTTTTIVLAAFRRQPALRSGWLLAAALFTLTSALIYLFGAADADFGVDALTGWLLIAAGLVQAGAAVALVAWPARGLLAAAVGVDVLLALGWVVSRTVGLPFGPAPWSPWQLGPTDLIGTAFELFAALALLWLVVRPPRRPSRGRAWRVALGLLVAVVVASYLGFAAKVTAEVDIPAPPLAQRRAGSDAPDERPGAYAAYQCAWTAESCPRRRAACCPTSGRR